MHTERPLYTERTFYYAGEFLDKTKWVQCFYVAAVFDDFDNARQYAEDHNFDLIKVYFENLISKRIYIYNANSKSFELADTVFSFYGALV